MRWRLIAKNAGKVLLYASSSLVGAVAIGTVVSAWMMVKPSRKSNYDCIGGVQFGRLEPLSLTTSDGLKLHAWVQRSSKAEANRWVLLLHGYRSDRDVLHRRRRFFARRGYNTLLLHFRGHGSSEASHISYGFNERMDVKAAIEYIRSLEPGHPAQVGIDGVSMGAAAAAYAIAFESVNPNWVILESCYDNIRQALANRLEQRISKPFVPMIAKPLEFVGEHVFQLPMEDLNPAKALEKIHCPVLVLAGDSEKILKAEEVEHLFQSIPGPKRLAFFSGAHHEDLLAYNPRKYIKIVSGFLNRFSPPPPESTVERESAGKASCFEL